MTLALSALAVTARAEDLRIGVSADYAPWESVDAAGEVVGFDRDFGNEVCARIEANCIWQNQAFDGLLPGLQIGKFDLVISSLSVTEERLKKVDFSVPYADPPNAFVVTSGSEATSAKSVADLLQKLEKSTIGVPAGSNMKAVVDAHFPNADVRTYDRPDQVADDLVAGRIDAGLMGKEAWGTILKGDRAEKLVYAGPLLTSADFPEFGNGTGIVMAKGKSELKARVDQAIVSMLADGTIKTYSEKWFGYDLSAKR